MSVIHGMTVGRYVEPNGSIGYSFASSSPATAAATTGTAIVNGHRVQVHLVSVTPRAFVAAEAETAVASIVADGICDKTLLEAMGAPAWAISRISKESGETCPTSGAVARAAAAPASYPKPGTIYYITCDSQNGAYNVSAYGCLNQKMAQVTGSTALMLDQIENTLSNSECNMTMVESSDYYQYSGASPPSTHLIWNWQPNVRIPVGNPRTGTATFTLNNVSLSTSGTIYPAAIEPWFAFENGNNLTGFGDYWYGNQGAGYIDTPSLDEAQTLDNGSIDAGVTNGWYGDNC